MVKEDSWDNFHGYPSMFPSLIHSGFAFLEEEDEEKKVVVKAGFVLLVELTN